MLYIIPTDTCFGLACCINDEKSYNRIYEIKGRDFNKHLAIMMDDMLYLSQILTIDQIDFLKNYSRPWTVLIDRNKIKSANTLFTKDLLEKEYLKDYEKFAFRVANNEIQKNLISQIGPIFLTSANLSGENEIYTINDIEKYFGKYDDEVLNYAESDINFIKPSDIFEFVGNTTDVYYLRKN